MSWSAAFTHLLTTSWDHDSTASMCGNLPSLPGFDIPAAHWGMTGLGYSCEKSASDAEPILCLPVGFPSVHLGFLVAPLSCQQVGRMGDCGWGDLMKGQGIGAFPTGIASGNSAAMGLLWSISHKEQLFIPYCCPLCSVIEEMQQLVHLHLEDG